MAHSNSLHADPLGEPPYHKIAESKRFKDPPRQPFQYAHEETESRAKQPGQNLTAGD
jgi:hypothetical protein